MLADIVLIVHFLFVLFVVGSLPLIWIGEWMRLDFVRNLRFRLAHMTAILFVVVEAIVGMVCPLTLLEDRLRGAESGGNFIQRWLHRILFYDVPEWILTMIYILFAILVIITFKLLPPRPRKRHP
ncbi:DUF2784 domain-containing protein [Nitrosospira sp. Nsp1]|uniref:DUF2784 domain-containing protein n=1 Tax=Nitrosospira sp. Nsp1 TaxID=136547 RepID=UPI00088A9BEA|nr:DUF2784 domain-containing protein [Nitrosospira sp. Nsp1]SCX55848.1 Protein of Unknown function [Nitrosospira sp. Nsp1]